jgi:hypothetical protein
MERPPEPEVPLADAGIAAEIARVAAEGRGADRAPTLEQLLAAFGEHAPTDAGRRRVAAALRVAGIGVKPAVADAEPGQRMLLLPPSVPKNRSRSRAIGGLAALAAVVVAAVVAASLLGSSDKGGRAIDDLPATSTTNGAAAAPQTTTAPATSTATTTGAATSTATTDTTETTSTTTTQPTAADRKAAQERRDRAAARRRAAAAAKLVTVRVDATAAPTFLCVDDGSGKTLFNGTLDAARTFKGRRVRLNIGLASTTVTVNGDPVRLQGSPTGLDITRSGGAKLLALGSRPCA